MKKIFLISLFSLQNVGAMVPAHKELCMREALNAPIITCSQINNTTINSNALLLMITYKKFEKQFIIGTKSFDFALVTHKKQKRILYWDDTNQELFDENHNKISELT